MSNAVSHLYVHLSTSSPLPMPSRSLFVFVCVILTILPSLAQAQPFEHPNRSSYARGDAVVMMASPKFTEDDLGNGYRIDLLGVKGARVIDQEADQEADREVASEDIDDTGRWIRRRANVFTLNIGSTALGMESVTFDASEPRRVMSVTLYDLTHVTRLADSDIQGIAATPAASLMLTRIYYGRAFNLAVVAMKDTFTPDAVAAVRRAYEEDRPLEPVLERYDLNVSAASRGLVTRVPWTAVPERIPRTWAQVEEMYPLEEPEPVFAEYTLLQDVTPEPVEWAE